MSDKNNTISLFGHSNDFFTIPLDGKSIIEDNSTFSSEEDFDINSNLNSNFYFSNNDNNNTNLKSFYYKFDNNDINNIFYINNKIKDIKDKNVSNNIVTNSKSNNDNNDNKETFYLFSNLDKKKYNSEINSSKIYSCEYLKNNWKNRAKLFLNRMKKKYTKKVLNNEI